MTEDPLLPRWRSIASRLRAAGVEEPEELFAGHMAGISPVEATAHELDLFGEWVDAGMPEGASTGDGYGLTVSLIPGHPLGPSWCSVTGGDLDQPVDVQIGRVGAAFKVTGLHIDNGIEITARTLRSVKTGEIATAVREEATQTFPDRPDVSDVKSKYPEGIWHDLVHDWGVTQDFIHGLSDVDGAGVRAVKGQTPTTDQLRRFAKAYLEELAAGRHGAMSRVSRRVSISRTTAYRWRESCMSLGLLPQEEQS